MNADQIDEMTAGYLECALFAASDYEALGMTETSGEFDASPHLPRYSLKARKEAQEVCAKFYADNAKDLVDYPARECGHDLWYTRNHHGVGFWEADYCSEEEGKRLSDAAHKLGETSVYRQRGWYYFE